jgi:hypothetical protein
MNILKRNFERNIKQMNIKKLFPLINSIKPFHFISNLNKTIDYGTNSINKLMKISKCQFAQKLPRHIKIEMPSLSPTMSKGNIVTWTKKEGDEIKPGDVIASIETDKSTLDFEVNEEGFLAKIIYPSGSKDVNVRTPIAILVEDKGDIEAFKNYQGEASAEQQQQQEAKPQQVQQQAQPKTQAGQPQKYPRHLKIEMPSLSPTMTKVYILFNY